MTAMWAVVTTVSLREGADPDALRRSIEDEAVPMARSLPGFVRGYWTLAPDARSGVGFVLYADEASARARLDGIVVGGPGPGGATITGTDVYEVLAEG
jgi:hypothetical protein